MLVKTIKYVDYDGNEREEKHYFNLNRAEVIKWIMTNGDYTIDKVIGQLYTERNGKKIIEIFEDLVHRSYGRKSLDGRKFEKSDEIWNDFYQTEAFSTLFTELVTDAKKASDFVNGIIPKDIANEVDDIIKNHPEQIPDELRTYAMPAIL